MEFDSNQHLADVLESHKMKHVKKFSDKVAAKKDEIIANLQDHYSSNYNCFNSGSMAKYTATNIKFDFDVVIPFKHSAFNTLSDMFDDVFNFLSKNYNNVATPRRQKVSVGIEFPIEEGDDQAISIDIVPGRELSDDDYPNSKDLNLCYNEDIWGFKKGSYQKTNISAQIEHIKGKNNEREIIRLLKIWKKHKEKKYKSFMIELICIKAFSNYNGSSLLLDRLKFAMEYIRDHITDESFHLYDPGNSSNDLMVSMDYNNKSALKSDMESILINIENNESFYLPYYFPINTDFDPNKGRGYGKKSDSKALSYPRYSERFGL